MKHHIVWFVGLVGTLLLFLSALLQRPTDDAYERTRDIPEVITLIEQTYVDEVDMVSLMPGAYQGVLSAVDENASYIPGLEQPAELGAKAFARTGLVLAKRNGYAYVLAIDPAGPASEAGLHAGAYLYTAGGKTTRLMNLYRLETYLVENESIVLTVVQKGAPDEQELRFDAASFTPTPLRVERREDGTLYAALMHMDAASLATLATALESAPKGRRVLLDLRNNALGDTDAFRRLAALFLPQGLIATEVDAEGNEIQLMNPSDPMFPDLDLYLLVDSSTSGAAETFAAIAKERGIARVIGEPSLGYPTHYEDIPLRSKGFIRLPTRKLVLRDGRDLTKNGVEPHEEPRNQPEDVADPLLTATLELIGKPRAKAG